MIATPTEHSHVWLDGELLLNGCALPHASPPLDGLDIEVLAEAEEWWDNEGWRSYTDRQVWPEGNKVDYRLRAENVLRRARGGGR